MLNGISLTLNMKYFKGEATLHFGRYAAGELAIMLMTPSGEHLAKATVCLVGQIPNEDYKREQNNSELVWLKTWSENIGLADSLQDEGVLELLPLYTTAGYEMAQLARLTPEALQALSIFGDSAASMG